MTISVLSSRRVDNLDFGKVFCTSAGKTNERRKNSFRSAAQKQRPWDIRFLEFICLNCDDAEN